MNVSDVMSVELVTVTPDTSLKASALAMLEAGISGLPVVDGDRLVGIITEADFIERAANGDRRHRFLDHLFGAGDANLRTPAKVGDVMTTDVVTVRPDDLLTTAARRMVRNDVKRLPVLDEAGSLIGVISRADVIRAFVRANEEIEREIAMLLSHLPIDPNTIEVHVDDGIVTLRGEVDGRPDALVLDKLVAHIDGVVSVHDELTWIVDDRTPEQRWPGYSQEGAGT